MANFNIEDLKKLREETGAGVIDAKKALEEATGDYEKAKEALKVKGIASAEKKSERETRDGRVYSYIHGKGKVGSMVLIACETDFVANTEDFQKLCHEVAMQICTTEYENVEQLLNDEYLRDPSKKIKDLVIEVVAKLGENIEIKDFARLAV